jgi:translation initiation factor 3 subunit M
MATFVDISTEEEQIEALVQYVGGLKKKKNPEQQSNLEAECESLLKEGKPVDVIISKLLSERDAIFFDTNDKEIEASMNVISAFIKKSSPDVAASLVQQVKEAVVSNVADRPILRLRILTNIYHAFERSSPSRYDLFLAITNFASESGNAELVIPKFKQIDQWLMDWGSNVDQSRKLYRLAHKILTSSHRSAQAHELITKYLQTFNPDIKEGKDIGDEVIDAAAVAAREAISSEEIYQCDHLFSLEAVKLLERHPKYAALYQLLQIFAQEKLESFQAFKTIHPDFLQSADLAEESCLRKIRLLSLASLGAENSEVPYSLIAQTLQISEDDVESWIIEAVSAKLIDAKLNQLKRVANVSFCVQRVFGPAQWKQLSAKLNKWRTSVHHILETVQQTKSLGKNPVNQSQPSLTVA